MKSIRHKQAFTILEMMIVIGIIGLMVGLALPHLRGFTTGSAMNAATRQMIDDVALARQRAMANRSEVDMVFLPPNYWNTNSPGTMPQVNNTVFTNVQSSNLLGHQYAAYALISMRTVGDQPGRSNVHYLTDWRVLPEGIFIFPYLLTNSNLAIPTVYVTNSTTRATNAFAVQTFPGARLFPFPSTYLGVSNLLPYIAFSPSGQLTTNGDQYILLGSGSVLYPANSSGAFQWQSPTLFETPPGNVTNNPNVIHIDWLTARAKLEQNSF